MRQDMTAREYRTVKIINSKEFIGQHRRDLAIAKAGAAAVIAQNGKTEDFGKVVRALLPFAVKEPEQTDEQMLAALMGLEHGPKYSDLSG